MLLKETATIKFLRTYSKVKEGDYLEYQAFLSNGLLDDLTLQLDFDTKNYATDYANPEDYDTIAGYSTDNGTTWQKAQKSLLEIPSGVISFKIRIPTLNDNVPEIKSEKFTLHITAKNTNEIQIDNETISSLSAFILDDDVDDDVRSKIDGKGYTIAFEKQREKFIPYGVASKAKTSAEKAFIDKGYKAVVSLVSDIIDASHTNVLQLFFGFKFDSSTLGAVDNFDDEPLLSKWGMYLNMAAFIPNQGDRFNEDGRLAATVVHELGHVLTLDNTQRHLVENVQECKDIFVKEYSEKSCYFSDSYAADFLNRFYNIDDHGIAYSKVDLKSPEFISHYAHKDYAEDLAESFVGYVTQTTSSEDNQPSYKDKIDFFSSYKKLEAVKMRLLSLGYEIADIDINNAVIEENHKCKLQSHSCVLDKLEF